MKKEIFLDCTLKIVSQEHLQRVKDSGLHYVSLESLNKNLFTKLNSDKFHDMYYHYELARELANFLSDYKKKVDDLYVNLDIQNISSLFLFLDKNLLQNFNFVFSHEDTSKEKHLKFIKLEEVRL